MIGTRGSKLALVQAKLVRAALERAGHAARLAIIETEGDRRPPDVAWGEGAFVVAVQRAVLDGRADIAVHSAKDVPTARDARLSLAAYLPRADPRDALVVRRGSAATRLADLAAGARVGTDSPRRTGFIRARRPDLAVHALHGNVDTRLRRLDDGETDALVLACAGLDRLGLGGRITERFEPDAVPPAPGQGAIAMEVRSGDSELIDLLADVDDRSTRVAVEAERTFLQASGGGCRAPVGALATLEGDDLRLLAGRASPDGSGARVARRVTHVADAAEVARELAGELRGLTFRTRARVLVTRSLEQSSDLVAALRSAGLEPVLVPAIAVEAAADAADLERATRDLGAYRWIVVTSANGARAVLAAIEATGADRHAAGWAAIGTATADALATAGIEPAFVPSRSAAEVIASELPVEAGDRVLIGRGDLAGGRVATRLRARGAVVDDIVAYRTIEGPAAGVDALRAAVAEGPPDAVLFTSGSTIRGLVAIGRAVGYDVAVLPAICIGPETAREARRHGFRVARVAAATDVATLAATAADALVHDMQEAS